MPGFTKNAFATPFGKNVFLRSTVGVRTSSRTLAAATVPSVTIDGFANQKVLQPGVVLAAITSGIHAGKCGPYQAAGVDEVQTATKTGTWSAGTFTITILGVTTAAIAFNATAAAIQAACETAIGSTTTGLTVTGGPISTTAVVFTFNGFVGVDQPAITMDISLVTGTTPGMGIVQTTQGVAGATDGREVLANIIGINNTFLPWQLVDRDVEVAVIYNASVVQANCLEMTAAGAFVALGDTTAAGLFAKKNLNITFAS